MSTRSLTLTRPSTEADSQPLSAIPDCTAVNTRIMQLTKSLYQTDQQEKFLHLQAEVESLLEQLQSLKQQRLFEEASSANDDAGDGTR